MAWQTSILMDVLSPACQSFLTTCRSQIGVRALGSTITSTVYLLKETAEGVPTRFTDYMYAQFKVAVFKNEFTYSSGLDIQARITKIEELLASQFPN